VLNLVPITASMRPFGRAVRLTIVAGTAAADRVNAFMALLAFVASASRA
jgi:hypothetical protein